MTSAEYPGDNLTDGDLQSEIELVGDLVVAATSSKGPLPEAEIDRLLGISPMTGSKAPGGEEPGSEPSPEAPGGGTDQGNTPQE
jgi:hypothetical protein